jgi:hypothetical protein
MNIKTQIIPFTILILGFVLGASALSTLAFDAPPSSPPTCPLTTPGCNPPINMSSTTQIKNGVLSLRANLVGGASGAYGLEVLNGISLIDAAVNPDGMVLTSNAGGIGNWKPLPANIAGGFDTVTSDYTLTSSNGGGTKSLPMVSATPQYPLCYITQNQFSGSNAFSNGCDINISGGKWVLYAYANAGGNESTTCNARCIGYSQPPSNESVSCSAPQLEYQIGDTISWFATVAGGTGPYTYKFTSQALASAAQEYSYTATNGTTGTIPKAENVTVSNAGGLQVGTATCVNADTNEPFVNVLPTLRIDMVNANNTKGLLDGCPGPVSLATPASRTITAVTPAGVSISSRSWKIDKVAVAGNTTGTYTFGGSITKKIYNLEHIVTASNGVVSSLLCPISII